MKGFIWLKSYHLPFREGPQLKQELETETKEECYSGLVLRLLLISFIIHPKTTCQGNGTTRGELDSLILSNNQNNTYQGLPIIQYYLKNPSIEIPFYIISRCEKLKIKANKYREHSFPQSSTDFYNISSALLWWSWDLRGFDMIYISHLWNNTP